MRDSFEPDFRGLQHLFELAFGILGAFSCYLALNREEPFEVTYLHDKFVAIPVLVALAGRGRARYVFSERNVWPWLYAEPSPGWSRIRYLVNHWFGKAVCHLSDMVHANSDSLKRAIISSGINERKIVIIPNGVDPPVEEVEPCPLGRPARVGFIGRLAEAKGVGLLSESIARLEKQRADLEYEIFGDGPLRQLIPSELPNCHLHGAMPREALLEALPLLHIALFLSPVENFPSHALLEALSFGKAVVATDVGDTRSLLASEHNALLCEPNPKSVSDAVMKLIRDPELYARITKQAQKLTKEYSWEAIADMHSSLMARL